MEKNEVVDTTTKLQERPKEGAAGTFIINADLYKERDADSQTSIGSGKLAKDGKTLLIPQPSDDPADPLNWSWMKKHTVLLTLGASALLTDWGMTWGTTMFEAQAMEWNMSVPDVSNSLSPGVFMQGPGGVFAAILVQRFGRLPVLFWSQFLSCMMVIAASQASGYAGFTAARTLQGLFNTAPQIIGLSFIHDMFFFHERARKINLWAMTFLIGPYLGPMISGFVIKGVSWRSDFGVLAGFYGFTTILITLFGDETLYDREIPSNNPTGSGLVHRIKLLTGIVGIRAVGRPTIFTVIKHTVTIVAKPYLTVPGKFPYHLLVRAFLTFFAAIGFLSWVYMFAIGITTSATQILKPPPYLFSDTAVALFFFAPALGIVTGELWGHFVNDFLCNRYIKKHYGTFKPEVRLWGVWPAMVVGACGLVLYGQTIQHANSWVGLAFGWAMNSWCMLVATTALSAYILDCFPHHAALASSWLNFWRNTGGFSVTYFEAKWLMHNGPAVAFGCQGAIIAGSFVTVIITQVFGQKWRTRFPTPTPEN
ncbi:MAG: hypothetical protein Q9227_006511 [Pyrenula ochraceoflavens]